VKGERGSVPGFPIEETCPKPFNSKLNRLSIDTRLKGEELGEGVIR
jgi:hypothetical protein